jgi:hypothetical protein
VADILRYWHAVETFEPHGIPSPTGRTAPGKERVQVFKLRDDKPIPPLPWEPEHSNFAESAGQARHGTAWRHTVYGGIFPFSAVRAELQRVLGYTEEEDYAGSWRDAVSATFAFTVDHTGLLIAETMTFSSCAWATGRLRDPGPSARGWLDGSEGIFATSRYEMTELLSRSVEYLPPLRDRRPAGSPAAAGTGADKAGDATADSHADNPSADWRGAVTETLGAAAAAAVGALIGTITPDVGGPVAAAALSSAAQSVMDRLTKRAQQAASAKSAATPSEPEQTEPDDPARKSGLPAYGLDGRLWASAPGARTSGEDWPDLFSLRPIGVFDIVAFAAYTADRLKLPDGLADHLELRIVSTPVYQRLGEGVLLSSLFTRDLKKVTNAAGVGVGAALASYLSDPVSETDRIDVRTERGRRRVLEGLHPAKFPPACWPSAADRRLVAGQQFAVNEIVAALDGAGVTGGHDGEGGLFAVNGPPGTGKTTLLRDLIAAVVVRRAEVLATLEKPQDGFTTKERPWRRGDGNNRQIWIPRADLTGFEIVVASSNNAAVENISKELPASSAVGPEWQADYFAQQATAVLGEPAWGLIAAALGNGANRAEFRANFWYGRSGQGDNGDGSHGNRDGRKVGGSGLDKSEGDADEDDADGIDTMRTHLRPLRGGLPSGRWQEAVDRFNAALAAARKLAKERGKVADALLSPVSDATVRLVREAAQAAAVELAKARVDRERADALVAEMEHAVTEIGVQRQAHAQQRPGRIPSMLAFGRPARKWRRRGAGLQRQLEGAERGLSSAQAQAHRTQDVVLAAVRIAADAANNAANQEARLQEDQARFQRARDDWGAFFPESWLAQSEDQQELALPWSDDEWIAARTEVFLAALDLHRSFVDGNAGAFLQNLRLLVGGFGRGARSDRGLQSGDELPAWQTFFLLIPVVSTTFASCGRMFYRLGRESLGWLIIDEAGQAAPQAAVGALWRARRAVIVGDPRQLEPISQVPVALQERLRIAAGLAEHWLPDGTSAQGVADRRSILGTEVSTGGESVWVGTPLRVHRRCEHPMFEMSNHLAYGGLMVYGTKEQRFPAEGPDECRASCWIDVPGQGDDGTKWVAGQGQALAWVLRNLRSPRFGVKLADIYVLSPFRDVVRDCRSQVRTSFGRESPGVELDDFIRHHIGTVHTMQGREADVVVLVLGADKSPARKARDWVGDPPNLLNVAVSRARRRLFVIGDYEEWANAPNFGVFAPRRAFARQPYRQSSPVP